VVDRLHIADADALSLIDYPGKLSASGKRPRFHLTTRQTKPAAAAAASEMTERTPEVSGEAEQTGQHGADARENATGLNAEVDMFIAAPHDRSGDAESML
jgi:hypothetical protein